ncbi:hypothetical protein TNCT_133391 [Trichonephila clavata]|uniref:Uncharacterized protein n=1 Tax=Trichonephila clavata TaxID=2740835 RepID=A0A8X6JPE7_TRICU|nr:hypothetical protein TNCT_133391 [Trichonephila clavata]
MEADSIASTSKEAQATPIEEYSEDPAQMNMKNQLVSSNVGNGTVSRSKKFRACYSLNPNTRKLCFLKRVRKLILYFAQVRRDYIESFSDSIENEICDETELVSPRITKFQNEEFERLERKLMMAVDKEMMKTLVMEGNFQRNARN